MSGYSRFTFHRKFKALTSMTPLAYQKRLRLIEARRLMIAERVSAEEAGFKVGYASPSQFSREYARMFRASPRKDVQAQGGPALSGGPRSRVRMDGALTPPGLACVPAVGTRSPAAPRQAWAAAAGAGTASRPC